MAIQFRQSITFKVMGIAILALLMLVPLLQVQGLVYERNSLRQQAVADIARRWGDAQKFGGPVLAVPKRVLVQGNQGWSTVETTEIVLADQLEISAELRIERRSYGIYSLPVYETALKVSGQFLVDDLRTLAGRGATSAKADAGQSTYFLDRAELRLPLTDVRGIRRLSPIKIGGREYAFGPGGGVQSLHAISVPVDASTWTDKGCPFELDLTLAGTQSLQFLPLARRTQATMSAPWPDPSFAGAFLPAEHNVDGKGFQAKWQVLDLNRNFGQHWQEGDSRVADIESSAFGVNLYQPVDLYQQNERAGKYGVLFIALTFVAFFLFEVLRKLRVHPVQYMLVGLGLTAFYVVLLALSEQIGFALAYLSAAVAIVLLIGGYAAAVLQARRAGLLLAAVLSLVYALLYGLVISEQYSLLMGSIALLAAVTALMYLTRKVDWYTYSSVVTASQ